MLTKEKFMQKRVKINAIIEQKLLDKQLYVMKILLDKLSISLNNNSRTTFIVTNNINFEDIRLVRDNFIKEIAKLGWKLIKLHISYNIQWDKYRITIAVE